VEEAAQQQRASSDGTEGSALKEGAEAVLRADCCSGGAVGAFLIVEVKGASHWDCHLNGVSGRTATAPAAAEKQQWW
jgi:hypothetical protein